MSDMVSLNERFWNVLEFEIVEATCVVRICAVVRVDSRKVDVAVVSIAEEIDSVGKVCGGSTNVRVC